jgi:cation transport ATPase
MEFDFSRLRRGERIAAIGGVLLFILMFFDWYDVSAKLGIPGFSDSVGVSAWDAFDFIDLFLLLTVIVAIGLAVLTAMQQAPALPVTASVITTVVAGIGTLLILFRIVDTPDGGAPSVAGIDVSPTFWMFVALVVTAGITYGGYLSMREEGTTLSDVRAQASAAGSQARAAFESRAPEAPPAVDSPPPMADPPPPPPPPSADAPPPMAGSGPPPGEPPVGA